MLRTHRLFEPRPDGIKRESKEAQKVQKNLDRDKKSGEKSVVVSLPAALRPRPAGQ